MLPVGAREFTPIVEEAVVISGMLQREDLGSDEGVEGFQVRHESWRQFEIHSGGCMEESIQSFHVLYLSEAAKPRQSRLLIDLSPP